MIPKTLHYCWFGGNPLPELAKSCIDSWKKHCADYDIIEWNEQNFDITINNYVKEAYESKKWAFVTDFVRLWVIEKYGGIYVDTDVEVVKSLDSFLKHSAFSGFERDNKIPTGIMGGEKQNAWCKYQLRYYENRNFILPDKSLDMTTNVKIITDLTQKEDGIILNNSYQELPSGAVFYPSEWFCPKNPQTGFLHITKNTHTIHHFAGSWIDKKERDINNFRRKYFARFGDNNISHGFYKIINIYDRIFLRIRSFRSRLCKLR